jgi:hypothetical protein
MPLDLSMSETVIQRMSDYDPIGATYHIMILVYFTVGSTSSGSAFVIAPKLGAKTIFESISL